MLRFRGSKGVVIFVQGDHVVMTTQLQELMTAGVFVEVQDARGNTLGQAVFTGWSGRPVPGVGDTMTCAVQSPITGQTEKRRGRVCARHFDVQYEGDRPSVWVRLVIREAVAPVAKAPRPSLRFSAN